MVAYFLALWVRGLCNQEIDVWNDRNYICAILPGGPIGINAVLKSGDELLEVSYESSMCGTFFFEN